MLQAMNTGHEGSLTTIHANTPRDAVARIETMITMAGFELPLKAMRQQVASAIDVIIQASRLQGGIRRITHITEVVGMEQDTIVMQDIYHYVKDGINENGRAIGASRPLEYGRRSWNGSSNRVSACPPARSANEPCSPTSDVACTRRPRVVANAN